MPIIMPETNRAHVGAVRLSHCIERKGDCGKTCACTGRVNGIMPNLPEYGVGYGMRVPVLLHALALCGVQVVYADGELGLCGDTDECLNLQWVIPIYRAELLHHFTFQPWHEAQETAGEFLPDEIEAHAADVAKRHVRAPEPTDLEVDVAERAGMLEDNGMSPHTALVTARKMVRHALHLAAEAAKTPKLE